MLDEKEKGRPKLVIMLVEVSRNTGMHSLVGRAGAEGHTRGPGQGGRERQSSKRASGVWSSVGRTATLSTARCLGGEVVVAAGRHTNGVPDDQPRSPGCVQGNVSSCSVCSLAVLPLLVGRRPLLGLFHGCPRTRPGSSWPSDGRACSPPPLLPLSLSLSPSSPPPDHKQSKSYMQPLALFGLLFSPWSPGRATECR